MNHRDRVYAAIGHEEPDKVPKGELEITAEMVSALLGRPPDDPYAGLRRCIEMLHMDLVNTYIGWPPPKEVGRDPDGRTIKEDVFGVRTVRSGVSEKSEPAIAHAEDIWSYEMPSAEVFSTQRTARWARETDYFISAQTGGPFGTLEMLLGWENMMIYSKMDVPAVADLARRAGRLFAQIGRMAAEAGANMIVIGDDFAYNSGTFLSPEAQREITFPVLKEEIREIKRSGVPVMLHCDGNLNAVLDDIVDCGFDVLHSLQPSAGMDIARIKADYGDRLCLMGNVDLDWLLPFGTTDQVRAAVRSLIRTAASGGGYIFSTCNALCGSIPVQNALAMYDEAERFGRYPIDAGLP